MRSSLAKSKWCCCLTISPWTMMKRKMDHLRFAKVIFYCKVLIRSFTPPACFLNRHLPQWKRSLYQLMRRTWCPRLIRPSKTACLSRRSRKRECFRHHLKVRKQPWIKRYLARLRERNSKILKLSQGLDHQPNNQNHLIGAQSWHQLGRPRKCQYHHKIRGLDSEKT